MMKDRVAVVLFIYLFNESLFPEEFVYWDKTLGYFLSQSQEGPFTVTVFTAVGNLSF